MTSNVALGAKFVSLASHPARVFSDRGLAFSLSSDNLMLSGDLGTGPPRPDGEVLRLVHDVLGVDHAKVIDSRIAPINRLLD